MVQSSRVAGALAAVMIVIALYCAGRLAMSALRRRETEFDADVVHVVMGVAMAGMFLPWLSPLPGGAWEAMFAAGGAWFGWQAVSGRRAAGAGRWCPHPLPHLVECVAMCYMLLALSGPRTAGPARGMIMPAMAGSSRNLPALALVLALFMVGYVIWVADQLASAVRGRGVLAIASPAYDLPRGRGTGAVLAPRLAACYKIAMGMTMGYMLILMI